MTERALKGAVSLFGLCIIVLMIGCFENLPEGGIVLPPPVDPSQPSVGVESTASFLTPAGGEFKVVLHVLDASGARVAGLQPSSFEVPSFFGEESGRFYEFTTTRRGTPAATYQAGPLSVALVIDQSSGTADSDPSDSRLEAAKRLLSNLRASDEAVLFAAATGGALPFPVTQWDSFTGDVDALEGTIDALAQMEGGVCTIYDAMAAALLYTDENASKTNRFLVVLTGDKDGASTVFTSAQNVVAFSQDLKIPVIVAAIGRAPDRKAMATLGDETGGMAFLVQAPDQLLSAMSGLPALIKGGSRPYGIWFTVSVDPPTLPFSGSLIVDLEVTLPDETILVTPFRLSW